MAQRQLKDVEKAYRTVQRAEVKLRDAMVAAKESGETLRDIGERCGLSPQRVHQIIHAHTSAG